MYIYLYAYREREIEREIYIVWVLWPPTTNFGTTKSLLYRLVATYRTQDRSPHLLDSEVCYPPAPRYKGAPLYRSNEGCVCPVGTSNVALSEPGSEPRSIGDAVPFRNHGFQPMARCCFSEISRAYEVKQLITAADLPSTRKITQVRFWT